MTKYTSGPWKYGQELSAHAGEWLVSFDAGDRGPGIAIAETRPGSGNEQANARLIAAAPDLLAALQEIVAMTNEDTGTFRKRGGTYRGLVGMIAERAVAKAEVTA